MEKNAQVILYYYTDSDPTNKLLYQWFLNSYSFEEDVINFSAIDGMAYTNNSFPMIRNGTLQDNFLSAQNIINSISPVDIGLSCPMNGFKKIGMQTGWSINQLLNYAGIYAGKNFKVDISDVDSMSIAPIDDSFYISNDNCSDFVLGVTGSNILQIRVSMTGSEDPVFPAGEEMPLETFGIYYFDRTIKDVPNTLKLVCPFADSDIRRIGGLGELLGKSFGTEFNCNNVQVDKIYPAFTHLTFEKYLDIDSFYLSSASYSLTPLGIFANMSGDTRSLSDFDYVGKTEKQLKKSVEMQMGYKRGFISMEDGFYIDDSDIDIDHTINSDEEDLTTPENKLKVEAFGMGLYKLGGDIFSTKKLLKTTINEDNVWYEYEDCFIIVTWTNQDGKRVDPHWQRVFKDGSTNNDS